MGVMIGLGAFRFVPSFFKAEVDSESVHLLNKCLCDELNAQRQSTVTVTQMYKLSMDHQGIVCIVVNPTNLVFEDECVESICAQIRQTHHRMQYPTEVMAVMSESIRNGIDIAKKVVDLQAGADYTVDSMARKVPLFGSVYGWLLPDGQEMEDEDGAEPLFNHTGVGFQIGVGVTKPQIQRMSQPQSPTPTTPMQRTVDSEVESPLPND